MGLHVFLRDVSRRLPSRWQARLRARRQRYWAQRNLQDIAAWRREMLIAPRLPEYSVGPHTEGYVRVIPNFSKGVPGILAESNTLTIGDYCSLADGVTMVLGQEHATDWLTTYAFWIFCEEGECLRGHSQTQGDITIGNDVWIGRDTLVLSGTRIGDGAVIRPGSVVRGEIPPYAIAEGNPCRVTSYRFEQDQVRALLELRWWDWPYEVVVQAMPILCSGDFPGIMRFAQSHSLMRD